MDPAITALLAVCGLDQKRLLLDFQDLIPVGRPRGNSAEGVAQVGVEKRVFSQTPSAVEPRNDLFPKFDFSGKRPVPLKCVVTALLPVRVSPVSHELGVISSFHAGTGAEGKKKESGKNGFHLFGAQDD
jgi:hypothetical protein